jgi:hypothetical protein
MSTELDLEQARAEAIRDLRFSRKIARLHPLGPRVEYELLREIGKTHEIRDDIEIRVDGYLEHLTPEKLRLVGADRMAAVPLHLPGRPAHEPGQP